MATIAEFNLYGISIIEICSFSIEKIVQSIKTIENNQSNVFINRRRCIIICNKVMESFSFIRFKTEKWINMKQIIFDL